MDFMKFIKLLDSSSITEVFFTPHVKLKLEERNLSMRLIKDLLLKRRKDLKGVEHQGEDRFKLTYLHPELEGMDLIVVVEAREVKSKMKLTVVTAFPQPSSRRIRVMSDE